MRNTALLLTAIATLVLGGCGTSQSAKVYTSQNVMQKMRVVYAQVIALREVDLENKTSGAGGTAGMALGAMAGSNMGNGTGAIAGAIVGAVAGGVAGTLADKAANGRPGIEVVYRLEKGGEEFVIVQELNGSEDLHVGDRVRVIEGQYSTRVVKAI